MSSDEDGGDHAPAEKPESPDTEREPGSAGTEGETGEAAGTADGMTNRSLLVFAIKNLILFFLLAEATSIIPGQFRGFSIPGLGSWDSGQCQNTMWIAVVLIVSLLPLVYLLFFRDRRGRIKLLVSGVALLLLYLPAALLVQTVFVESIAVPICGGYNSDYMDFGNLFEYRDPIHYMSHSRGFHTTLTYLFASVVAIVYLIGSVVQIWKRPRSGSAPGHADRSAE